MTMTLQEVGESTAAIGNQIAAGVPLDQVIARMQKLQPRYRDFWMRATLSVQGGGRISTSLREVWPVSFVKAVESGEESGRLDQVFARIAKTVVLQQQLMKTVSKLYYPIGMGAAGLGVFLMYVIVVIPEWSKSLGSRTQPGAITQLSIATSRFLLENWMPIAVMIAMAIVAVLTWAKSDEGKAVITEWMLATPRVGAGLRDIYFGIWAEHMSMAVSAGVPTPQALVLTAPVLPMILRESIERFERDLTVLSRPMDEAADLECQASDDPRTQWWPFYIANAFIVAESTGQVDVELERVTPSLINEGTATIERFVDWASVIILVLAGVAIVSPIVIYYLEAFNGLRDAFR